MKFQILVLLFCCACTDFTCPDPATPGPRTSCVCPDGMVWTGTGCATDSDASLDTGISDASDSGVTDATDDADADVAEVDCVSDDDCSDGDVCNGTELCIEGRCAPGETLRCDDGDPCTTDECDLADGCFHVVTNDGDGDGFPRVLAPGCVLDLDCDDSADAIRPGATETCDGADQDCDRMIDEAAGELCFQDLDTDGYPDADGVRDCECATGIRAREDGAVDCYDRDDRVRPNQTRYFPEPHAGGSFDWNCDGREALRWTASAEGCDVIPDEGGWIPPGFGMPVEPPRCGSEDVWRPGRFDIQPNCVARTQECR